MWFSTLIVRNLLRRTARFLLTVTGAAVAIGTVVALLGVVSNFRGSLSDLYGKRGIDLLVVRAGAADRIQSLLPEEVASRIKGLKLKEIRVGYDPATVTFEIKDRLFKVVYDPANEQVQKLIKELEGTGHVSQLKDGSTRVTYDSADESALKAIKELEVTGAPSKDLPLVMYDGANVTLEITGRSIRIAYDPTNEPALKVIEKLNGQTIKDLPLVQSVTPGLLDMIAFPEKNLFAVPLSGRAPDGVMLRELTLQKTVPEGRLLGQTPDGTLLSAKDDEKCAILGYGLAEKMGKKVGDKISIYEEEFNVVGIFQSFSPIENGSVFVTLKELQRLMRRPGEVTAFLIVLEPSPDLDKATAGEKVRVAVEQMTNNKGEPLRMTAMTTEFHVTSAAQLKIADAMTWLTSSIALILGSVGMLNTMVMSVFERTKEIGILRALGWRKSRILWMILWESWAVSLWGAVFGVAGAYVTVWALSFHPTVGNAMSPWLPPSVCVQGLLVAFVMGFIGGIYPAIRAALLLPTEAVRHE
jgi:putative ABC transport system permease protein